MTYRERKKLDAKVVRIFNTFGPRMRLTDGRLIPDLVKSALAGEPLQIYGRPDAMSTFCFVTDMIDGIVKMMKSPEGGPLTSVTPMVFCSLA